MRIIALPITVLVRKVDRQTESTINDKEEKRNWVNEARAGSWNGIR